MVTDRTSAVVLEDVCFRRGDQLILDGVSMEFPRGQVTAVMGPSGTGKTTLLRLIGGQLRPDSGRVLVNGVDMARARRGALYAARKRMGVLFQNGALFTDLNVFENVAFPLREHAQLPENLVAGIVRMKLEAVGLRGAAHLMPAQLSGGMARRVALARAIALDPDLMLYDEPFAGQDPISMGVLVRLIESLNEALGMSSILVSHDVPEVLSIARMAYVIADGQVVGAGSPEQLRQHDSPWVCQFIRGEPDGPLPFHYPGRSLAADFGFDDPPPGARP
ncbi:MAG: ABC transporter ATP-binding protein [Halothiobacillaceae bacterium]